MCWSGEASALISTAGLGSTAYFAYKGENKALWIPLGFFSLMELLQAITYYYIDDCGSQVNHVLTVLQYMHIAFQPFFINAVSMYFVPDEWRKKIAPFVYTACFVGTVFLLLKLYPFHLVTGVGQACTIGSTMCGETLCAVKGNWHIAWNIPLSAEPSLSAYVIVGFLMPLLYGSWRLTIFHFMIGPFLAYILTDNPNEWPAIWCLFSIGLILIIMMTRVRKLLFVKKWYFWKFP